MLRVAAIAILLLLVAGCRTIPCRVSAEYAGAKVSAEFCGEPHICSRKEFLKSGKNF